MVRQRLAAGGDQLVDRLHRQAEARLDRAETRGALGVELIEGDAADMDLQVAAVAAAGAQLLQLGGGRPQRQRTSAVRQFSIVAWNAV